MTARPIGKLNAIEAVAFGLVYERPFDMREAEALFSLERLLAHDLPSFSRLTGLLFNVPTDGKPAAQQPTLTGVILQHFNANGKADWVLRAHNNQIVVNCFAYESWSKVWPQAKRYLEVAGRAVYSDTNGIGHLVLQIIDKFEYETPPPHYDVHDVFREDSPFLTPNLGAAGSLWHVNQGWFADAAQAPADSNSLLHVLNLSSAMHTTKLVATIDHSMQMGRSAPPPIDFEKLFGVEESGPPGQVADRIFRGLHDENIAILCKLLRDKQLTAVGIEAPQ